jgi:hypothetical protein
VHHPYAGRGCTDAAHRDDSRSVRPPGALLSSDRNINSLRVYSRCDRRGTQGERLITRSSDRACDWLNRLFVPRPFRSRLPIRAGSDSQRRRGSGHESGC